MKIIQGGQAGIAAQFEAAGIEIEQPAAAGETTGHGDSSSKKPERGPSEDEGDYQKRVWAWNADTHSAATKPKKDAFPTEGAYQEALWNWQKPQRGHYPSEEEFDAATTEWEIRGQKSTQARASLARKTARLRDAEALAQTEYNGRRQAEERAEALQRELDELKAKPAPAKPAELQKPKRADFESDDAYNRATIRWEIKQEMAEERKKEADQAEKDRQAKVVATAHERIAQARELIEDFDEVLGAADIIVPPHVAEYMQESEMFAELSYHFAKHPEDLERLAKLPHRTYADVQRLGVAIAKIEGKIQPFAPSRGTKSENGEKPSQSNTDGQPKTETSEAKPSPTATAPSKRPAPVITPLPTGTGAQTDNTPRTQKEHVEAFGKREGVNLYQRKRH